MISISVYTSIISAANVTKDDIDNVRIDLENEIQLTDQEIQDINNCTNNLKTVASALRAYENENGNFPEWLSDLYPDYLTKKDSLICTADEDNGVSIIPFDVDPNLPVSYNYDCDPEYYERWLKLEREVYNGTNPIVRCPHHVKTDTDATKIYPYINLSFSYDIFLSIADWKRHPERVFGNLKAAILGLETALELAPEEPSFFYLYPDLLRLYLQAERVLDAKSLIEKFKTVMKPHDENIMRFRDYWTYIEMLKIIGQHQEALRLLLHLEETEKENPFRSSIFREIALIHEEKGEVELANQYFRKADSRLEMIGKPAPEFSVIDVDGNTLSLKDFHGKVLLIDFWSTTCGPCIGEMPNVRKVYDEFNDMGFEVIGISLDEDEARLNDFLNTCKLPWSQIFTGEGWDTPIRKLYKVRGIPSPWLIDREGKVISYKARGSELRRLVSAAILVEV